MSVVAAEPEHPPVETDRPPSRLRRVWSAPVWAHLGALALILVALMPLVGTDVVFSADEGAAAVQAESLARGDGWIVEHPLPAVDPDGRHFPLENSEEGIRGSAPFGKHPGYALLVAGAGLVGGFSGMVALSILGTVAAAGLAAALARRLDPSLSRSTLWVVGLASPLLFDSFIVIAHTLGAAAATAAVLLAVIAIQQRRTTAALAVAPAVALAVLLRNEAVLFAVALGVAAAAVALRRHSVQGLLVTAAAVLGGALAHVGERAWVRSIVGGNAGIGGPVPSGGTAFLADRVDGFVRTWMSPSLLGSPEVSAPLLVMLVALLVGAFLVRRHPTEHRRIMVVGALAAASALAALALGSGNLVPGLLIAFPLMGPGILLVRRSQLRSTAGQVAAGTAALFAVAVLATQYARGGTAEWGGRYFALALPIAVPVLLLAVRDSGSRLDHASRRVAAGALAVCMAAMALMALGSLRLHHRFTAELTGAIDRAGADVAVEQPVFVTSTGLVPRLMWHGFKDQRWLVVRESERLPDVLGRLQAQGVSSFVFVTPQLAEYRPALEGAVEVARPYGAPDGEGWQVRILRVR